MTLDPQRLEQSYHQLGRRLHPDRFATGSRQVREASLKATALLTRSYRTLRDPVSRGLYWLVLNGEKLAENNKQVPVEIADSVFEVQEQLAGLRSADGADAPALLAALSERRAALKASMDEAQEELARNFARWDQGIATGRPALIAELKAILSRIAYLRTLIRDVDRELESAGAATA